MKYVLRLSDTGETVAALSKNGPVRSVLPSSSSSVNAGKKVPHELDVNIDECLESLLMGRRFWALTAEYPRYKSKNG